MSIERSCYVSLKWHGDICHATYSISVQKEPLWYNDLLCREPFIEHQLYMNSITKSILIQRVKMGVLFFCTLPHEEKSSIFSPPNDPFPIQRSNPLPNNLSLIMTQTSSVGWRSEVHYKMDKNVSKFVKTWCRLLIDVSFSHAQAAMFLPVKIIRLHRIWPRVVKHARTDLCLGWLYHFTLPFGARTTFSFTHSQ